MASISAEQQEVEAIPTEISVTHPLKNQWVLWFDNPDQRLKLKDWGNSMKEVVAFDTVEDFWGVFNNVRPPSHLNPGFNYLLFRKGIRPTWECQENKDGGKWNFRIPKRDGKKVMDDLWLSTMLSMIGENFDAENEICGAAISMRKAGDRVAMWTKTAEDEKSTLEIGTQFQNVINECLQTEIPKDSLEYLVHNEELKSSLKKSSKSAEKMGKYKL